MLDRTRLYSGASRNQGYLEVYEDGAWIDVCDDSMWGLPDATVACRSFGMKGPSSPSSGFERGTQTIFGAKHKSNQKGMWYFQCKGNEESLQKCPIAFSWWRNPCREVTSLVCIQGT